MNRKLGRLLQPGMGMYFIVMLGFAAKHVGFDKDTWLGIIEKTVPAKTIEINKEAFIKGYEA